MRKRIPLFFALLLVMMLPVAAFAEEPINGDFECENLLNAILAEVGKQPGDDLYKSDVEYLTSLVVNSKEITSVKGIENLTRLTTLRLFNNQISDIAPLDNLTQLTILDLGVNQISNVTPLENLTKLTNLSLNDNNISDITPLKDLTELEYLSITDNQITDISSVANLINLKKLSLSFNQISNIEPLQALEGLNELSLADNNVKNLEPLKNLTGLTALELSGNQIVDISVLKNLTKLNSLLLSYNQIFNVEPLQNLTELRYLYLNRNYIGNINFLQNLTELIMLDVGSNNISNITPLQNLVNLKELYLYSNRINDIAPLNNLTELIHLNLNHNQVSEIEPLQALTKLAFLHLENNKINLDVSLNREVHEYFLSKGIEYLYEPQYPEIPVTVISLDREALTFTEGDEPQILKVVIEPHNATNQSVNWTSSNETVATVVDGLVTPVGVGTATITATTEDGGFTATCEVIVNEKIIPVEGISLNKTSLSFIEGDSAEQLTATVEPSNASNQSVNWTSSDETVATIVDGLVTPVGVGTATITATTEDGGFTATCEVTVNAPKNKVSSISFKNSDITIFEKEVAELELEIVVANSHTNYSFQTNTSDHTVVDIAGPTTFKNNIATIPIIGHSVGEAVVSIVVTDHNNNDKQFTASCNVTVTPKTATITDMYINPATATVDTNSTLKFNAVAEMSDGTEKDISNQVSWSIQDSEYGTISSNGLVTTTSTTGTTSIFAEYEGMIYTAQLTVEGGAEPPVDPEEPEYKNITVTPATIEIKIGEIYQLTTTITHNDNSITDETSNSTYSSLDTSIATVDSSGVVTAKKAGTTNILVEYNGLTYTVEVTVKNAATGKSNLIKTPDRFLYSSLEGDFVEFEFDGPIYLSPIHGDNSRTNFIDGNVNYEIDDNILRVFSNGTGQPGSLTMYIDNVEGHSWFTVGVAGDYMTTEVVDYLPDGEVLFKVHCQLGPDNDTPVVGRDVSLRLQAWSGVTSEDGLLYGSPVTMGEFGQGVTDENGDTLITVRFEKNKNDDNIIAYQTNGQKRYFSKDISEQQIKFIARADCNIKTVTNSWQTWEAGNRWPNIMTTPFELVATPLLSPGAESNSVDVTPTFIEKINFEPLGELDPTGTVKIHYQDSEGNTIKDSDVYEGVIGTNTYTAPAITGYNKPTADSITITISVDSETKEHTFIYIEEEPPVPPADPKGTVVIYYADSEGNTIKDSDVYEGVTGTNTYTAPTITGYNKPTADSVTITISVDGETKEHTFVYTEKEEPPVPPADPTGTVKIHYQDTEGNTIRNSDIHGGVTGTNTYTAPAITGYSKPTTDSVTITISVDGETKEHTFVYSRIEEPVPPVVPEELPSEPDVPPMSDEEERESDPQFKHVIPRLNSQQIIIPGKSSYPKGLFSQNHTAIEIKNLSNELKPVYTVYSTTTLIEGVYDQIKYKNWRYNTFLEMIRDR